MKFNYMRIFSLFILLVSIGVFTSCSSIDKTNTDSTADAAFVGDWKLVKATFTGETPDASEFAGFTISLKSEGTYVLTNPTNFPSPTTGGAGVYQSSGLFLTFDANTSVNLISLSGNSMVWEWQVARPGKITATYRYTFERM